MLAQSELNTYRVWLGWMVATPLWFGCVPKDLCVGSLVTVSFCHCCDRILDINNVKGGILVLARGFRGSLHRPLALLILGPW
jgi:hypothetical protein